jgi:hypothetical protein
MYPHTVQQYKNKIREFDNKKKSKSQTVCGSINCNPSTLEVQVGELWV